jgi:hypothetical protein
VALVLAAAPVLALAACVTATAALTAVLLDQLLHLLALLLGEHRPCLLHRRLAVLAELLVQRTHLLAEALERLPLLLGELRARLALPAAAATAAHGPLLTLAALAAAADLGEARLAARRVDALHDRCVALLQPLLDALQARHLRVAQAELLAEAEERLGAVLPTVAAAAALPLTALLGAVARRRLLLRRKQRRGTGQHQRGCERTNLHRPISLQGVVIATAIRLRYKGLPPPSGKCWLADD